MNLSFSFSLRNSVVLFLLLSVFLSSFNYKALGQDVLLEVHAKPFNLQNSNLVRTVDSSPQSGTRSYSTSVIDLGLTLSLGNLEKLLYVVDLNWYQHGYRDESKLPPNPNNQNRFQSSSRNTVAQRMEIGIGIDRPFTLHRRFITTVGGRLLYAHQFNDASKTDYLTVDSLGVMIDATNLQTASPNGNTFGLEAVGRIYFKATDRLSFGMGFINHFGLTVTNGDFTQEQVMLDANGNETDYYKQTDSGTQTRFAYNFSVSFGIQYQIARRKEKKKQE